MWRASHFRGEKKQRSPLLLSKWLKWKQQRSFFKLMTEIESQRSQEMKKYWISFIYFHHFASVCVPPRALVLAQPALQFPFCSSVFFFPSVLSLSPSFRLLNLFIHIRKHEAYRRIWCLSLEWISGSKQYIWDKMAKWLVLYWYALACYPFAWSWGITNDTEPSLIFCLRCS